MSGDGACVSGRPRPLSGGLWTLFSWLRRDEHSSTDSLSSAGSARTAASFAFLAPAHYGDTAPARVDPPPPPSDSYRRRVRERSLRRQRDRDLTLHRKYGLYGLGYDALSLPSAAERDRRARAASESPRAHVPGKRRAPPPPVAAATLPRRRARKRPAPLPPPLPLLNRIDEIVNLRVDAVVEPMNRPPSPDGRARSRDAGAGCKPEKYSKKDAAAKETKDVKLRQEKSFLKQIFENRKRNSAIETSSVKLLPSISELDKQAAEMIEKYRLKECTQLGGSDREFGTNEPGSSKRETEAWICTRCLKKYDSSVITCDYCLPLNKASDSFRSSRVSNTCTQTNTNNMTNVISGAARVEDREKLKEMLKEMKDSLPKRPKNDQITVSKPKNTIEKEPKEDNPKIVEAPTLRIGSPICIDKTPIPQTSAAGHADRETSSTKTPSQNYNAADEKKLTTINSVIITQPVVLVHTKSNVVLNKSNDLKENADKSLSNKMQSPKKTAELPNQIITRVEAVNSTKDPKPLNVISKAKYDLNTPLKISSLLNPIYVPKTTSTTNTQTTNIVKQIDVKTKESIATSEPIVKVTPIAENAASSTSQIKPISSYETTNKEDKKRSEIKNIKETKKSPAHEIIINKIDVKIKNTEPESVHKIVAPQLPNLLKLNGPSTSNEGRLDQHTRRRDLINQLEQSIAKGDERAAAEAAVKLAQLRLSCSVLSFSSQIVAEASTSQLTSPQQINVSKPVDKIITGKVEEAIQKSSQLKKDPIKDTRTKHSPEKKLVQINEEQNSKLQPTLAKMEDMNIETPLNATPDKPMLSKLESTNKIASNCETKTIIAQNNQLSQASTSKDVVTKKENDDVPILVWVEDKEATRGPVQLHVRRSAVLGDLRRQAEKSLGLAARMQRWIVGKTLCSNDNTSLVSLAGVDLSAPFYLCLVESDTKDTAKQQGEQKANDDTDAGNVYNELVKLEKQPLVSNTEVFECGVCIEACAPGRGVVLRECVHSFCKECLSDTVRHSEEPVVSCPAMGCRGNLQEREIRGLVSPEEYERWLARGLAAAESGTRNAFHCRTRDCAGWALCEPGVRRFPCPVCKRTNCVPCQAIHEEESCEEHRTKLQSASTRSDASQTDEGTRALLDSLIARGEALECPECSAVITKKWGCDWVKCSACKTEICWVTRGRRWGPAGRGDTSAGCRCGLDGKRCHPSCGYCH